MKTTKNITADKTDFYTNLGNGLCICLILLGIGGCEYLESKGMAEREKINHVQTTNTVDKISKLH